MKLLKDQAERRDKARMGFEAQAAVSAVGVVCVSSVMTAVVLTAAAAS